MPLNARYLKTVAAITPIANAWSDGKISADQGIGQIYNILMAAQNGFFQDEDTESWRPPPQTGNIRILGRARDMRFGATSATLTDISLPNYTGQVFFVDSDTITKRSFMAANPVDSRNQLSFTPGIGIALQNPFVLTLENNSQMPTLSLALQIVRNLGMPTPQP